MDRRVETRVVETGNAALVTLISKDAAKVYWISASPVTPLTQGDLEIIDGFDAAGLDRWHCHPDIADHFNFIPGIDCEQGVTVVNDANIHCYTICWRVKKWDRPRPHPGDVVTAPKP